MLLQVYPGCRLPPPLSHPGTFNTQWTSSLSFAANPNPRYNRRSAHRTCNEELKGPEAFAPVVR